MVYFLCSLSITLYTSTSFAKKVTFQSFLCSVCAYMTQHFATFWARPPVLYISDFKPAYNGTESKTLQYPELSHEKNLPLAKQPCQLVSQ